MDIHWSYTTFSLLIAASISVLSGRDLASATVSGASVLQEFHELPSNSARVLLQVEKKDVGSPFEALWRSLGSNRNNRFTTALDSYLIQYPGKYHRLQESIFRHQQAYSSAQNNLLDEPKGRTSRFYYFNEDLPSTSGQNAGGIDIFGSGVERQGAPHWKKRELEKAVGQPQWMPLYVQTDRAPFHFHIPILPQKQTAAGGAAHHHHHFTDAEMLREATSYKNPLDFDFASVPTKEEGTDRTHAHISRRRLTRRKRGLGSWIKSVLHIKSKPTSTERPPARKVKTTTHLPQYEYSNEQGSGDEDPDLIQSRTKPVKVHYHKDQHGDTEVDWLLPKALRKSSFTAKRQKVNESSDDIEEDHRRDPEGGGIRQGFKYDSTSRDGFRNQKYSQSRLQKYGHGQPYPRQPYGPQKPLGTARHSHPKGSYEDLLEFDPYEDYGSDSTEPDDDVPEPTSKRSRRLKRAATLTSSSGEALERGHTSKRTLKTNLNLSSKPVTKLSLRTDPITAASKEELRLLHELFVTIVNEKCPKHLHAPFVEHVEENWFRTLDASPWPSSEAESSPQISALIHQLVNCSIAAEGQKELLQILSSEEKLANFHARNEVEAGGPLFRRKRGKFRLWPARPDVKPTLEESRRRMSNIELSLLVFVAEECKGEVDSELLLSVSQLMLETVLNNFVNDHPLTEEETDSNLDILQTCATLIVKHRQREMRLKRKLQETIRLLPLEPLGLLPIAAYHPTEGT